jgi:phosphatidylglycerol---prolipoprotein diacylglyceryl transferase
MIPYHNIDPIAFKLGPLAVHWYGITYLCAFVTAWYIGVQRAKLPNAIINRQQVEDLITWGAFGVIIGGRLGSVFFYNFDTFLEDPLWALRLWEGGMSFHGGLLGVMLAMYLYAWKLKISYVGLMDFVAPLVPLGLFFGRIGNFIGGELWGRATDVSWGMIFPKDTEQLIRHPSQLYQACLEGLLLFVIVFWFSRKPRPRGAVSAIFLMGYSVFRFIVEFYREPDQHIGYEILGMTRGQELCALMFLFGVAVLIYAFTFGCRHIVSSDVLTPAKSNDKQNKKKRK